MGTTRARGAPCLDHERDVHRNHRHTRVSPGVGRSGGVRRHRGLGDATRRIFGRRHLRLHTADIDLDHSRVARSTSVSSYDGSYRRHRGLSLGGAVGGSFSF